MGGLWQDEDEDEICVRSLLDLGRWYLDAMRLHTEALEHLLGPLLRDEQPGLEYAESRVGAQLDHAVFVSAAPVFDLLIELKEWERDLNPVEQREVMSLEREHEVLMQRWKHLMEATDHVWCGGRRPQ